jgi:hypothetical protein
MLWRGNPTYIANQIADIRAFYKAELTDPLTFLEQFPVQTIIWNLADDQRMPEARLKLDKEISRDYRWRAFSQVGEQAIGVWERRISLPHASVH